MNLTAIMNGLLIIFVQAILHLTSTLIVIFPSQLERIHIFIVVEVMLVIMTIIIIKITIEVQVVNFDNILLGSLTEMCISIKSIGGKQVSDDERGSLTKSQCRWRNT